MSKKKAMISQPMNGRSKFEIATTRAQAVLFLDHQGYEVVNTYFEGEWFEKEKMEERGVVNIPLCFLAKSLEVMSQCDALYLCPGWEEARGCRIEVEAAVEYGLEIITND